MTDIFHFEAFELDTEKLQLRKDGELRKTEPQVFDLLHLLVRNRDRVVTKDEINREIWGGRIVSDAVVNSRIRTLRQSVDDDGRSQRLIKTIHKRGFRFIGDVWSDSENGAGKPDTSAAATAAGGNGAIGDGPTGSMGASVGVYAASGAAGLADGAQHGGLWKGRLAGALAGAAFATIILGLIWWWTVNPT